MLLNLQLARLSRTTCPSRGLVPGYLSYGKMADMGEAEATIVVDGVFKETGEFRVIEKPIDGRATAAFGAAELEALCNGDVESLLASQPIEIAAKARARCLGDPRQTKSLRIPRKDFDKAADLCLKSKDGAFILRTNDNRLVLAPPSAVELRASRSINLND